jgi:phage terminase small subunit
MSAPIETRQQLQPQLLTIPADFGGLTLKQNSFCDHYLTTGNATDAAIKAGFTLDRNSASTIGARLLRNVKVQAEIKRRLGISIASPNEVLETLTKHARADLTDVLDTNGQFDYRRARRKRLLKKLKVKKRIEHDKDGNVTEHVEQEFEIHDPQAALEKLGRFHKLFTDKVETSSELSAPAIATEVVSLLVQLAERNRATQLSAQVEVQPQQLAVGSISQASDGSSSLSSSSQPIVDVPAPTRNGEDGP